eukprot:CAMPEP_0116869714 /NCGR_PEP_ID=MMETSP0418-20121206/27910_1 /TAXON_ID=1158023 /ORGANISM="Astrosyne radiata, Strain 13vi08-1A" /LENGTH=231 /DNA_ID=CAMNT_0004505835 /DNA_START=168 /DNA_END=863 /DNA_ORIENTATION=+
MTQLKYLQVENGQFTGRIPTQLSSLPRLSEYTLQRNFLEGPIPIVFPPELQTLKLSTNLLTGTIPESLQTLSKLLTVDISNNMLTGTILDDWISPSDLVRIQHLVVRANFLNGTLPSTIQLHHSRLLDLSFNDFTGTLPETWVTHGLVHLILSNLTRLNGTIPTELGNVGTLRSLDLGYSQLRGTIPTEFGNFFQIEDLRLQGNHLTGTVPTSIADKRIVLLVCRQAPVVE